MSLNFGRLFTCTTIHLEMLWRWTSKTRDRPPKLIRFWSARRMIDFWVFAYRFDSRTRRVPQSLQWYCCCFRRFVPFLTMFVLPHTRQLTTFHPVHPKVVLEARSLLVADYFRLFLTISIMLDGLRQKHVVRLTYWNVHNSPGWFALVVLACKRDWAPKHHVHRTLQLYCWLPLALCPFLKTIFSLLRFRYT